MLAQSLTEKEFAQFQRMLCEVAGIHLAPAKKLMLAGRLGRRVRDLGLASFGDYFQLLQQRKDERQLAVDLLTTNETYFFREPKHFEFLQEQILPGHPRGRPFRVWSAACSSGEEPYSLAMLLDDRLGDAGWEVLASDISTQVLDKARRGLYGVNRIELMPAEYRRRYCLRGIGAQEGLLLLQQSLRSRVQFRQINLNAALPGGLGNFDLILLRNVMIYFQQETRRQVVQRIVQQLRPGGYLFVGHSESLNGIAAGLQPVRPSVYRRAA